MMTKNNETVNKHINLPHAHLFTDEASKLIRALCLLIIAPLMHAINHQRPRGHSVPVRYSGAANRVRATRKSIMSDRGCATSTASHHHHQWQWQ